MRLTPEVLVLAAACLGDAAVLIFVDDTRIRVLLGLLLLAMVVWSAARLGVIARAAESLPDVVPTRRYHGLRSNVQQLLAEIRRLNWLTVDADRGFRSREHALEEINGIESRLHKLLEQIIHAAGQETQRATAREEEERKKSAAG